MSYTSEVLADSPIAYWLMNEASGPTLYDSSGNGHDLTITDATGLVFAQDGLLNEDPGTGGRSLQSTGTNDHGISTGTAAGANTAFNTSAWTVEGVVKFSVNGGLFSRNDGGSQLYYGFSGGAGSKFTFISQSDATGITSASLNPTAAASTVYHLAATFDGVNTFRWYVNGVLSGTVTTFSNLATIPASNGPFLVMGSVFRGWMEKVAVYGTVLTATRILAHYNAGRAIGAALSVGAQVGAVVPVPGSISLGTRLAAIAKVQPQTLSLGVQLAAAYIPNEFPGPGAPALPPTFTPATRVI